VGSNKFQSGVYGSIIGEASKIILGWVRLGGASIVIPRYENSGLKSFLRTESS